MTTNAANYELLNDFNSPSSSGVPTSVGTNGKASFFGTYDQNGNVFEHTEKTILLSANDKFSPVTTPSGSNVFNSVVKTPEDDVWPQQYKVPKTEEPNTSNFNPYEVPTSQLFSYAKEAVGGAFVSSSGDISSSSRTKYMLPSDYSKTTGFRIGSIAEEFTYSDVHIPYSNAAVIYVKDSKASGLINDMSVVGDDFDIGTRVVRIDNNIIISGGIDYRYLELSSALQEAKANVTATFSLSNPLNIKNMVLVDQEENSPDTNSYGAVNKKYYIGKYPVTNSEYASYLNIVARYDDKGFFYTPAKNASDLGMSIGINRSLNKPYAYTCSANMADKPVVCITWIQAARYCNWLHNSHNNTTSLNTNNGAYDLSDMLASINRSTNAKYFIPNMNEWYKAAYYDKVNGSFVYRKYATRSDIVPAHITEINRFREGPYKDLTSVSLFDRFRFDSIANTKWISILNKAADRWDQHISTILYNRITDSDYHDGFFLQVRDATRYNQMKEYSEKSYNRPWNGLYLSGFNASLYPNETWVTSCNIMDYAITNDGTERWMPISFDMNVNLRYLQDYNDSEWGEIFAHELGHALGIGSSWNKIPNAIEENYFMNRNPFLKTNIEYNRVAYGVNSGYHRLYTPLEQSAGVKVQAYHWENNYIPSGLCFVPLNCSVDTDYLGISEDIMNPYYQSNGIISNISVANLIDLGYYSKTGNLSGEGNFVPSYNSVQSQSINKVLGLCSRSNR